MNRPRYTNQAHKIGASLINPNSLANNNNEKNDNDNLKHDIYVGDLEKKVSFPNKGSSNNKDNIDNNSGSSNQRAPTLQSFLKAIGTEWGQAANGYLAKAGSSKEQDIDLGLSKPYQSFNNKDPNEKLKAMFNDNQQQQHPTAGTAKRRQTNLWNHKAWTPQETDMDELQQLSDDQFHGAYEETTERKQPVRCQSARPYQSNMSSFKSSPHDDRHLCTERIIYVTPTCCNSSYYNPHHHDCHAYKLPDWLMRPPLYYETPQLAGVPNQQVAQPLSAIPNPGQQIQTLNQHQVPNFHPGYPVQMQHPTSHYQPILQHPVPFVHVAPGQPMTPVQMTNDQLLTDRFRRSGPQHQPVHGPVYHQQHHAPVYHRQPNQHHQHYQHHQHQQQQQQSLHNKNNINAKIGATTPQTTQNSDSTNISSILKRPHGNKLPGLSMLIARAEKEMVKQPTVNESDNGANSIESVNRPTRSQNRNRRNKNRGSSVPHQRNRPPKQQTIIQPNQNKPNQNTPL